MFGDQKDSLHEYDHAKGGINQYYLAMLFQSKRHFQFLKERYFQISFSVLGYITTYICFATVFGPRKTTVLESEETKRNSDQSNSMAAYCRN